MTQPEFDVVVIGSGPGGYVAAIRAAQLKLKTAIVERDRLGGVCLNWGCIPTKALLRSAELFEHFKEAQEFGISAENIRIDIPAMVKRSRRISDRFSKGVGFLLKQNRIALYEGTAALTGPHEVAVLDKNAAVSGLSGRNIIIATGGRPRPFPGLPFDGQNVLNSTHAMLLESLPESLVIIGAGAIGIEFAYYFSALGCHVTLLEMKPSILPLEDPEISAALAKILAKRGIEILTGTRVTAVNRPGEQFELSLEGRDEPVRSSKILVATGIMPNTENLGLEGLGVALNNGFVVTDTHCRTHVDGIFAIGDVTLPPLLAHKASAEGIMTVETIAGLDPQPVDCLKIPACTYCKPQIASIGLTEPAAKEQFGAVKVGTFPFRANGRALAMGDYEGFVKIIFNAENESVLGIHMIGPEVTELSAAAVALIGLKATKEQIHQLIFAHPTLSEALHEAAEHAFGQAIHIPNTDKPEPTRTSK